MKKMKYLLFVLIALIGISATVINDNDKYFEMIKNIEIFTNVYKELNTHYVDEIDPAQLMRTGIDAMVKSLDPYTNYYSESQVQSYRISNEGKYNGIGAVSKLIDDWVTISEIIEGGPAQKAGLQVGDQIRSINGESTEGRSNDDIVQFVRGFPGSSMTMMVRSYGSDQNKLVTLDRSTVEIKNVPYSGVIGDDIAYIALTTFTANAAKNISKALKDIKKDHGDINGLILDLRSNGGGLLREAVAICNLFIPAGKEVVSTRGKVKDRDKMYKTTLQAQDAEIPLAVLINGSSASASEIVSGVIQDYDRGVVIGQRSYGKGLVQNQKEVGYNSRVKVTTSKYYIPSGRCIQSVEYEDGEPKDITDDKRTTFKTKNGRKVLDGGGVTPDVKLDIEKSSEILTLLKKDNWIFKYINDYESKNVKIENVDGFQFTDYQLFKSFLKDNEFAFSSIAEKEFNEFKTEAEASDLELSSEMAAIERRIKSEKADDLDEFKEEIIHAIEVELISRSLFETGKTQLGLDRDIEIIEAIAILKDKNRLDSILSGK